MPRFLKILQIRNNVNNPMNDEPKRTKTMNIVITDDMFFVTLSIYSLRLNNVKYTFYNNKIMLNKNFK